MGLQRFFCKLGACDHLHDRANFLAKNLVRNTHNSGIHHIVMAVKRIFNFNAVDVLTRADQHVFSPVQNVEETFLIHFHQVSSAEPTAAERLFRRFRFVPIAFNNIWPTHPKLTNFTNRQIFAALAHNAHIRHSCWHASTVRAIEIILSRVLANGRRGFCQPISICS